MCFNIIFNYIMAVRTPPGSTPEISTQVSCPSTWLQRSFCEWAAGLLYICLLHLPRNSSCGTLTWPMSAGLAVRVPTAREVVSEV